MKSHVAEVVTKRLASSALAPAAPSVPDYESLVLARGKLRTPEGDLPVKRIGKGSFAEVYRETSGRGRVFALVADDVYDKEILAESKGTGDVHVPDVERYGNTRDRKVYTMPHYRAPLRKADSPRAWADYRILEDCVNEVAKKRDYREKVSAGDVNRLVVECAGKKGASPGVVSALEAITQMATNYDADEYALEIKPRNLATDDKGNLVLLDVIYNRAEMRKLNDAKYKRQMARDPRRYGVL